MIIKDKKLRDLFRKGPNFREQELMNWNIAKGNITQDINKFIDSWGNKLGKSKQLFTQWKLKLLEMIDNKYLSLKDKVKIRRVKKVLKTPECKKELSDLKEKYVLTPIDKAANNIGFVCKKYYLMIILEELRSQTYEQYEDINEVIEYVAEESSRKAFTQIETNNRKLPQIHAIIKMHKSPIKFRFIIGDRNSILKQLAKKMVRILQLIMKIHKNYCEKIKLYTGIERYWIIENSAQVLQDIHEINARKGARNIANYDFSTLYTKISQSDLKEKLKAVVEKGFKGGQNQFITIHKSIAKWGGNKVSKDIVNKEMIFNMIETIIDNAFFTIGTRVYRQSTGIPMGIDPAPQMANLYLYWYEYNFMENLTKMNYGEAKKFNYTRRFIDDLNTLNNDGKLEKYNTDGKIYPKEMCLNRENTNDNKGTFLDLDEEINDNKIKITLYDKREDFKFEIVNYPHLDSNIPQRIAYGVFTSQLIRFARICTLKEDLIARAKILIDKLLKKKYTIEGLRKTTSKCMEHHKWIERKISYQELINIF